MMVITTSFVLVDDVFKLSISFCVGEIDFLAKFKCFSSSKMPREGFSDSNESLISSFAINELPKIG